MDTVLDPEAGATTETIDLFAVATYQALDDYTLELVLPRPDAALLDGFTAQWLSRVRDFDPQMPIGTGPFKFVEWERNQHIKMVRNADYWREGLPYLDELTIAFVPDPSTRIAMLLTGEIDVVANVPLPEVGRIAQRDEFQLISTPEQYNAMEYYMLMKNSAPPFDDARVRQAVNYAIDREALQLAYRRPLPGGVIDAFGEFDARFQDEVFTSVNNFTTLDSYWLADVRAGIEGDYWRLIAYVNNVFDDDSIRTSGSAPDFGAVAVDAGVPTAPQFQTTVTLPNPRVFGIRLSYSF